MKTCTKCGVEKPLDAFRRQSKLRGGGPSAVCKPCDVARVVAWQKANAEKRAAISRRYYQNNPDRFVALAPQSRVRMALARARDPKKFVDRGAEYRKAHPEKARATVRAWKKANPERVTAINAARRARKLRATPAWTNHVAVGEFYAFAALKARMTGAPWHVDHIVPLKSSLVCGLHTHYNLQVLPGAENLTKGNRCWPDMPTACAV